MKKLLFIFCIYCCIIQIANAQPEAKTLIAHGDTLFLKNFTTNDSIPINPGVPLSDTAGAIRNTMNQIQAAVNGKQAAGTYATGSGSATGTNTGDNAANTTYANDYRAANFVAGTNYLAPNGNGSSLTGLTKTQVSLANADNTSDAAKPVSTATQTALDLKAPLASPTFTGTVVLPASTSLTTPVIGAATGTSLTATGFIGSTGTAGIGYTTGAGGAVTQATNKGTGVTLNKICGEITLNNAALAAATIVSFTLTNSAIAATDVIILNHVTTGTRGAYTLNAQCANGSAVIYVRNNTAGSLGEAIVIRYTVIKGVVN